MGELLTLLLPFSLPSARSQDYGGYLSTYILPAKGENQGPVFTCGSALSPITDFKLYGRGPNRRGAGPTQPPPPGLPPSAPSPITCRVARPAVEPHRQGLGDGGEGFTPLARKVVSPPLPLSRVPDTRDQEPEHAQRLCLQ